MIPTLRALWILPLALFVGCSEPEDSSSEEALSFGRDLHSSEDIEIQQSSDGLERTIKVYNEEWLGDRYSDPKFSCEASSLERLLRFLAEKTDSPINHIAGASSLPNGTYRYSFKDKSWKDEEAIFIDVVNATEEAFGLQISISQAGDTRTLEIQPK
jgi:hypothetical protein